MKRMLLFGALALAGMAMQATPNLPTATQWVEGKEDAYDLESWTYYYDINNALDSMNVFHLDAEYNMDINMGFHYDKNGNQIDELGYQRLKNKDTDKYNDFYTATTRVFYTYDDLNRLTRRVNYNFFAPNWERGGIYVYSYEGNTDRLVKKELFSDEALTSPWEMSEYEYNDKGNLLKMTYTQFDSKLQPVVTAWTDYEYDDQDRLTYRKRTDLDFNTGKYQPGSIDRLTYDEQGNIIEELWYMGTPNNPTQRYTYTYHPVLRSTVCYPVNIESEEEDYCILNSPYAVNEQIAYAVDQNGGGLQLYDTYTYIYSNERPMREEVGVKEVTGNPTKQLRYADGKILLDNFRQYTRVSVYDLTGRVLKGQTILGSAEIDLSDLPSGGYVIAAGEKTLKIWK